MNKTLMVMLVLTVFLIGCQTQVKTTTPVQGRTENVQAEQKGTEQVNYITIKDFAFTPSEVTVSKGTVVTWFNADSAKHTVAFDNLPIELTLNAGESQMTTFSEAGEFSYHCSIHPSMKGKVIVK